MEANEKPSQRIERSFTTQVLKADDENSLTEAVKWLRAGEVVAFPTETVYGLGANALDPKAVSRIFEAKGRPSDNPLIVHVSSVEMLSTLIEERSFQTLKGSVYWDLISKFWPGPLTILFRKSELVPKAVTAGQPTVAIRMPSHPIARRLIELAGVPVAAPSANLSGRPSPTCASHVYSDLAGRIPCIVDGGPTTFGVESTVVDLESCVTGRPLILRPGGVTLEQLRELIPTIESYEEAAHGSKLKEKPPTPGLKYTHYSPNATVILILPKLSVAGDTENFDVNTMREQVVELVKKARDGGEKVGIVHTHPNTIHYPIELLQHSRYIKFNSGRTTEEHSNNNSDDDDNDIVIYELGIGLKERKEEVETEDTLVVAKGIFQALRDLESMKVDTIVVEGVLERHIGRAVMNRLRKAATRIL
eukprot:TRINITY_DN8722_c0_g1_i1.p1 TRINITY_DN8722_c0_g1~~TRINITY_DN8722_c0_g1_i1.p1  ORF type:complete len:419 (+),score=71.35 TRINITY_DN8722_c0_g1_i1:253-1509(+)